MVFFSFAYPKFLFLLFLIPLFVLIYFFSLNYHKKKSINFPNFSAMQRVFGVEIFSKNFASLYLNMAILFFIILALSGTYLSFKATTSPFSYVIAIDNSNSMNTNDLTPSRLEAARFSAKKFVDSLPFGAEVAVIEFSGQSKVLQELDASKFKAKMAIDLVELREDFGTDIDNVLYDANIIFEGREKKSIILLSDGQINIGNLERSIKYAKERNFVVNTIAVGTSVGGLTDAGSVSRVDEDNLQKISTETGGQFFRIDDLDSLDRSFKDVLEQKERDVVINISSYLLIAALALFSFNWLIHNFRFKTIP